MLLDEGTCAKCGHGDVEIRGSAVGRQLARRPRPATPARLRYPAVPVVGGRQDHRPWTPELVAAAIRRWHRETGRTPRRVEWVSAGPWWPSTARVVGIFGTWKDAIRAAGLEPPAQGRPARTATQEAA